MLLIVGLGNPGKKYTHTRHNIGFMVVDQLAGKRWQKKHKSEVCKIGDVLLVKPQTFMNKSGEAVAEIVRFYKIPTENILLIYDDLDTDFGKVRFREKGSSGGHNGLKSIAQHLGTETIARVKIGIGRPPANMDPAAYVLQNFTSEEKEHLPAIIEQAGERTGGWVIKLKPLDCYG